MTARNRIADKIAAVLGDELFIRGAYIEYGIDDEPGQWERVDGHINIIALADAVIRELADECRAGCMWKIPNHIEDMTEAQRERLGLNHYCRYCGGFGPEQSQ